MTVNADRIPVIIGIGQINDRPERDDDALDSKGLMLAALSAAERDAGAPILNRLDWLGVEDQISFPSDAIHEEVAAALPKRPANVFRTEEASGAGPTELLNEAANLIGRGEARFAATVGGEALRTAARWAKVGISQPGGGNDRVREIGERSTTPLARRYGLATPTDVYPLYENATRKAWGQSLAEAQAESGRIWSTMSEVAAANPSAWLRKPVDARNIVTPSADNRAISFPYTKLMVANSSVNQGAAMIVASLAAARELGIDEGQLIYIGAGAGAHEDIDYLRRDGFQRSASLDATIAAVLERNDITVDDIDMVELYSCFPCIPKMARRALAWPLNKPTSVYGGLTFGGGPIGNCMMHAAAAMVEKLRAAPGTGVIVSNGGFATHSHAIMLSSQPAASGIFPQDVSVQPRADALRGRVPALLDSYVGPGTIETYSVPYDRNGKARFGVVVGRTPAGERFLAHVPADDRMLLDLLTDGTHEAVGTAGIATMMDDGRSRWTATPQGAAK